MVELGLVEVLMVELGLEEVLEVELGLEEVLRHPHLIPQCSPPLMSCHPPSLEEDRLVLRAAPLPTHHLEQLELEAAQQQEKLRTPPALSP